MQTAFIFKDEIYSFRKPSIAVYIKAIKLLQIGSIEELADRISRGDLESTVVLMYCSLRDTKNLTLEEFKEMDLIEFELLARLFLEVNK